MLDERTKAREGGPTARAIPEAAAQQLDAAAYHDPVVFRAVWCYGDPAPPEGTRTRLGLVGLAQMRERVVAARMRGELSDSDARAELNAIKRARRRLEAGEVVFGLVGRPFEARTTRQRTSRDAAKRARRARKAQRRRRR